MQISRTHSLPFTSIKLHKPQRNAYEEYLSDVSRQSFQNQQREELEFHRTGARLGGLATLGFLAAAPLLATNGYAGATLGCIAGGLASLGYAFCHHVQTGS